MFQDNICTVKFSITDVHLHKSACSDVIVDNRVYVYTAFLTQNDL